MVAVSTTGGIAYGLKTTLSFGLVGLVALVCTLAGTNLVTGSIYAGYGGLEVTRWGQLLGGSLLSVTGLLALYGATFGVLYKVVADGVRRGNDRAV
ncbi:hypothetical protein [Halosimplex pelagicum]|uniref:Uncharacterized protein n=1 Tax=Halosimplex pelagicum TaxID=869886 RepID=A0A7D5TAP1_9EURY|nr:hypothetical protein [Halosimplex pelagicum]QLH80635.1 hypothetical protein HZS54_02855 [Halosimplex pelagicum]